MYETAVTKVSRCAMQAIAVIGAIGGSPALAEQTVSLSGTLVACPAGVGGIYCLDRADAKGVVKVLDDGEDAPMYFMRDVDVLITQKTKVTVDGVLKSPSAFSAEKGLTVKWANGKTGVDPGLVMTNDPIDIGAPQAAVAQPTTLEELGQLVASNQARALALYGSGAGFALPGRVAEINVEANDRGERFAGVLIGPLDGGRNFNALMWGEKARVVCYIDLASASRLSQGQQVTVSGAIADIKKIRYYDQFWKEWREPFIVASYPCRLSESR
ncbi:hypothetical protein [Azospirillum sp. TSO22-1]|uniref:hypothetical protein n=1 Tax=Azospirillum sp. TSO22-1 TaxID=716789 RepID=UPI000D616717|nr:hypothetical protein [Azospirillum sp. TSO22-1]PWC42120.1 hypothetical protein TSO221_22295 [Azospirillum sp. TSO22-1]